MNSFQLIITYLKFSILFVFEYPFYIDCLFTIYAVALHLFERTCKLCKKDVEDEIHFVCVCPALELIRMKYFKILNIDKSELLIDQLSRVLTHMNVNMVINFTFYCVNISYLVDQCICPARSRSRQTLDKNVLSWALTGTGSVLLIRQVS